MEAPREPEVERACQEAAVFARRKRRHLELASLLYGLLAARGECTRWLFEQAGHGLQDALRSLDEQIRPGDVADEPLATENYVFCEHLAGTYAQLSGVWSIREQDLLWALLNSAPRSKTLQQVLANLAIDLTLVEGVLTQRYRRPSAPMSGSA